MKKLLFAAAALTAAMMSSCNSDDPGYPVLRYGVLDFESAPIYAIDKAGSNLSSTYTGDAANLYTTYTDATTGLTMGLNVDEGTENWNTNKPEFYSGGIAPSKFHDMATSGYSNQCSVYGMGGYRSPGFGIVYYSGFTNGVGKLSFGAGVENLMTNMWVANSTYVALYKSLQELAEAKTWFKLTVTGYDKNGTKTGVSEKYLIDFREESKQKGMLTDWTPMSLTDLGRVNRIEISLTSDDPILPTYVCIDDVTFLL